VRAAAHGQSVLAPSVASRLVPQLRSPAAEDSLSERELEVLTLVAGGATNRDAAQALLISEATEDPPAAHLQLSVSDRAAAVAEAFNRGLLKPEKR
jgi:DNA-binding NarL/FixJ family response regulator